MTTDAPLRVVLVDDEPMARAYLAELVEESGRGVVVAAVEDAALAREALNPSTGVPADLVFMDVQLTQHEGSREGLALTQSLLALPRAPLFVLATASPDHALTAYELGVFDYLRKPFTPLRVERCLHRAWSARGTVRVATPSRLIARRAKSLVFVPLDEAWAFEASERATYVHGREGRLDLDQSLVALESQFAGQVLRVHRNWLVNVDSVREIARASSSEVTLRAGTYERSVTVPVSRDRASVVRATLMRRLAGDSGPG